MKRIPNSACVTYKKDRESEAFRKTHLALAREVYGSRLPWWLKDMFDA